MNKIPLQWKVFVYLIGFCLILLSILWLFQTVFLEPMYQTVRKRELSKAIQTVEQNLENPELPNILTQLAQEQEIIVMRSNNFLGWKRQQSESNPVVMSNGRILSSITEQHDYELSDGSIISLTFYAIISPVSATVATLQYQLLWISGVLILMSVMIAFLIARHVATPLQQLNQSAKQLALGNYDTLFSGKGFVEVSELSDTLNATAQELSQVERLRKELLANISHDLRTPLALIYSYAEWLNDFPQDISTKHTTLIMEETKRLSSLVDDVLKLSQLESNTLEPEKKSYSLRHSVQDTITRVGELVREDGYQISLICDPPDSACMVFADESKITQAFYNLLLNAINHSGEDQQVIVTLSQSLQDQSITLAVQDHGAGISPENLSRIWDRYYKVDHTHKRSVTGTGLGLSIVKKIISAHGGTYGAESDGIGTGSRFYFTLPNATPPSEACLPPASPPTA